jgi:hypothetical protein
MSKYKIRRIANNKTVIAQSGINEMTDIVSTKDVHSANPFVDKAIDPESIIKGTAGLGFVKDRHGNVQRESVNPEYGMFTGAPGEGMPMDFKMTAEEMQKLNRDPKKLKKETDLLRKFLQQTQKSQLNQIIPKLESLYAIYRSAPYGLSLTKLKEEARMIRQLSPMDKQYLMTKPYWPLIKDIVK